MRKTLLMLLALLMIALLTVPALAGGAELTADPVEAGAAEDAAYGYSSEWASRDGEPPVNERAMSPIEFNEETEVDFYDTQFSYFYFTPTEQARYRFFSRGSSSVEDSRDTVGYLFDEDWNLLAWNDDSHQVYNAGNFSFYYVLKPGQEYYLLVKAPRKNVTGVTVMISYTPDTTETVLELDEEHIPDAAFREVLAATADINQDGHLTEREVSLTDSLDFSGRGVRSLDGLEIFTSLTELNCSGNEITELDVSMMPSLLYLRCYNNDLTSLTLGEESRLREIYCYGNELTELDISGCLEMSSVLYRATMTATGESSSQYGYYNGIFWCYLGVDNGVSITAADGLYIAGENDSVVMLDETGFPDAALRSALSAYDYNKNGGLSERELARVATLTLSNVSSLQGMERLASLETLTLFMAEEADETDVDLSVLPALKTLTISLTADSLDLRGCGQLESVTITSGGLGELVLGEHPSLYYLSVSCSSGAIPAQVDISGAPMLLDVMERGVHSTGVAETYSLYSGERYLSVPPATEIVYPEGYFVFVNEDFFPDEAFRSYINSYCDSNQSGILSRDEIARVDDMYLDDPEIVSLEGLRYFTALTELTLSDLSALTELDLSDCEGLTSICCSRCGLTSLDVSGNAALTGLTCWGNQLAELDVTHNPLLAALSCSENLLTALDLSHNTALETLDCGDNALAEIDVTALAALTSFDCGGNPISSLDLSGNPLLSYLTCSDTSIRRLDLRGSPALVETFLAGPTGYSYTGTIYSGDSGHLVVPSNAFIIASDEDLEHEHEFIYYDILLEPTCGQEGLGEYTCAICGETYTEAIPTTLHTLTFVEAAAATTEAEGHVEHYVCSVCGRLFSDEAGENEITAESVVLDKLPASREGWRLNSTGWWYQNADGSYPAGAWRLIGNRWYHFDAAGYMQTGWLCDGGTWYYLTDSGAMATGWQKIGNVWYYFQSSGAMATGWQKINNVWYYFFPSGSMAAGEWAGGYWLNANGSWTYPYKGSWKQNSTGWWFGDTSGWYAKNETVRINGTAYAFNAAGYWIEK